MAIVEKGAHLKKYTDVDEDQIDLIEQLTFANSPVGAYGLQQFLYPAHDLLGFRGDNVAKNPLHACMVLCRSGQHRRGKVNWLGPFI